MIIKRNFKNSRKAEKAAALLALMADKGGGHGRCLSAEEMAVLVDSGCGKEELAIFMKHLSECGKCYGEWLTLKKMADSDLRDQRELREGRVYRLSRFKKYSFIGSALAAAASVAVFLNISRLPEPFEDTSYEDAVPVQSESKSVVPKFKLETEVMDLEAEMEQPAPVKQLAKESQAKERLEKRELQTESRAAARQKRTGTAAPAAQAVPQDAPYAAKKAAKVEVEAEEGVDIDGETQLDIDSWLEHLQENCLADRQEADFWLAMHLQGKELLVKQAGSLAAAKEQKVSAVLALLAGMGPESVKDQCRQLLAILAEEEKSM